MKESLDDFLKIIVKYYTFIINKQPLNISKNSIICLYGVFVRVATKSR